MYIYIYIYTEYVYTHVNTYLSITTDTYQSLYPYETLNPFEASFAPTARACASVALWRETRIGCRGAKKMGSFP